MPWPGFDDSPESPSKAERILLYPHPHVSSHTLKNIPDIYFNCKKGYLKLESHQLQNDLKLPLTYKSLGLVAIANLELS